MKRQIGSLATVLFLGVSILGLGAMAGAQQAPPASQQPMEIPPQLYPQYPSQPGGQYPPQMNARISPQPGGPQQGGPRKATPSNRGNLIQARRASVTFMATSRRSTAIPPNGLRRR